MLQEGSGVDGIARDRSALESQMKETNDLLAAINEMETRLHLLAIEWKDLANSDAATPAQAMVANQQIDAMQDSLNRQRKALQVRQSGLTETRDLIDQFMRYVFKNHCLHRLHDFSDVDATHAEVMELLSDNAIQDSIQAEPEQLMLQQAALKQLRNSTRPLGERVDKLLDIGHRLIRSAPSNTDTSQLVSWLVHCSICISVQESAQNKVNDVWNELMARTGEREQRIDGALQQLSNYQDSHQALLNWLEESEQMLINQRPPSTDYKVVKAQLQAYDVIMKHIDDKQATYVIMDELCNHIFQF
jgi:hypothetical protein